MDKIYIYDNAYKSDDLKKRINISNIEGLFESKVTLHNDNLGKDKYVKLFEIKGGYITPQFVGKYVYGDKEIISLPKHLAGLNEEEKHQKELFRLFYKFRNELCLKDNLFNYSERFNYDIALANRIKDYYLEYGMYTEKYMTSKTKHGRISWANTVKKVMPVIVDGSPVYTNFVYQNIAERSTEITKIELSILKFFVDEKLIDEIEIPEEIGELYLEKDFIDRKEYFLRILQNEQSNVFDDVRLDRLQLMVSFFEEELVYESEIPEQILDSDILNMKVISGKKKQYNDNDKVVIEIYCEKVGDYNDYPQYYFHNSGKYFFISDSYKRERMSKNGKYSVTIKKWKDFWNVCDVSLIEKDVKNEKDEQIKIYAIAQYSKVFEVLLAHYFEPDNGIKMSKDGVQSFKSNLFSEGINDVNELAYRPYVKMFVTDYMSKTYNAIIEKDSAYDKNFIDVAFDGLINNEKCSIIIDAKDYGWNKDDTMPSIPTSGDIFKQFQYEHIMERIYRDKKVFDVKQYNVFVMPAHKEKENVLNKNLWWAKNGYDIFTVYGHITDELMQQSIICLRVDVQELTKNVLDESSYDVYDRRKEEFIGMLNEYINSRKAGVSDKDKVYFGYIRERQTNEYT